MILRRRPRLLYDNQDRRQARNGGRTNSRVPAATRNDGVRNKGWVSKSARNGGATNENKVSEDTRNGGAEKIGMS